MASTLRHGKSFGFGFRGLRRNIGLIPLATILGAQLGVCVAFVGYGLAKSDVVLNKKHPSPPWERIDPEKPQKLYAGSQEWKRIPELESLKHEMEVGTSLSSL